MTALRVNTFWFKEPETIDWLKSFKPGDIFLDVGANMGLYSLFAACAMGARVFAFEPEALNYANLNQNIFLNQMGNCVTAYPLALSDELLLDRLHISHFMEGGSCHNFKDKLNFNHEPLQPAFSQGCLSISLDELITRKWMPPPNHIKIDVDGIEHKVIRGAIRTVESPEVRSVLIELNTKLETHREIIDLMHTKGFSSKPSETRGVTNYIFSRN